MFYTAWYIILGALSVAGCDNLQDIAVFMKLKNQWFDELLGTLVKAPSYIENNLHWVADVIFREDEATNKTSHMAENLTLIRRLVMNMVNVFCPSIGLSGARRFATHEPEYLKGILAKIFGEIIKSFNWERPGIQLPK